MVAGGVKFQFEGEAAAGESVEVTDDAFLTDRLRILQPARGYRAGLDAVLLAAAACRACVRARVCALR